MEKDYRQHRPAFALAVGIAVWTRYGMETSWHAAVGWAVLVFLSPSWSAECSRGTYSVAWNVCSSSFTSVPRDKSLGHAPPLLFSGSRPKSGSRSCAGSRWRARPSARRRDVVPDANARDVGAGAQNSIRLTHRHHRSHVLDLDAFARNQRLVRLDLLWRWITVNALNPIGLAHESLKLLVGFVALHKFHCIHRCGL
jgi:hypothetical protein